MGMKVAQFAPGAGSIVVEEPKRGTGSGDLDAACGRGDGIGVMVVQGSEQPKDERWTEGMYCTLLGCCNAASAYGGTCQTKRDVRDVRVDLATSQRVLDWTSVRASRSPWNNSM